MARVDSVLTWAYINTTNKLSIDRIAPPLTRFFILILQLFVLRQNAKIVSEILVISHYFAYNEDCFGGLISTCFRAP